MKVKGTLYFIVGQNKPYCCILLLFFGILLSTWFFLPLLFITFAGCMFVTAIKIVYMCVCVFFSSPFWFDVFFFFFLYASYYCYYYSLCLFLLHVYTLFILFLPFCFVFGSLFHLEFDSFSFEAIKEVI